jgi:hypothetical protein
MQIHVLREQKRIDRFLGITADIDVPQIRIAGELNEMRHSGRVVREASSAMAGTSPIAAAGIWYAREDSNL